VIEFALLFGLGFLSAALAFLLLAPAIHRRIVRYTERRLQATMPLSPQEISAQRDMARATYAAENAKASIELTKQREKATNLEVRNVTLSEEARKLLSENRELKMQVEEMSVEAADLRSKIRDEDGYILRLKQHLGEAERALASKGYSAETLQRRVDLVASNLDTLKIEIASRDTEIENLKYRLASIREERETLRNELKEMTHRAKEAEFQASRQEGKVAKLENRLEEEAAKNADSQTALRQRIQDIRQLTERLKAANADARNGNAVAGLQMAGADAAPAANGSAHAGEQSVVKMLSPDEMSRLREELYHQNTALSERLLKAGSADKDDALRAEIATMAAKVVALTASEEGAASPIRSLLADIPMDDGEPLPGSLAERARKMLSGEAAE
jgi:DNA repair exonuclease SbcCD ATPase subunit